MISEIHTFRFYAHTFHGSGDDCNICFEWRRSGEFSVLRHVRQWLLDETSELLVWYAQVMGRMWLGLGSYPRAPSIECIEVGFEKAFSRWRQLAMRGSDKEQRREHRRALEAMQGSSSAADAAIESRRAEADAEEATRRKNAETLEAIGDALEQMRDGDRAPDVKAAAKRALEDRRRDER